MAQDRFELLLSRKADISDFVNSFTSEAVQQRAFEALITTLGVRETAGGRQRTAAEPPPEQQGGSAPPAEPIDGVGSPGTGTRKPRKVRPASKKPTAVKDLSFRPEGQQSFRDFAAEKSPSSHNEKVTVAVFYLESVLQVTEIGAGHVLAAYRAANWREPADLSNTMQVAASVKGYLDTSDMSKIKLGTEGWNLVHHDLPKTKK